MISKRSGLPALVGPTLLHLPAGVVASAGAECVKVAERAGLILDDWQCEILDGALSVRRDGCWAAFEVGQILPRQNGKNAILEARQLAGLFHFREVLQVHSAHEFKTALEHFIRIRELVENTPAYLEQVKIIRTGSADMSIELKTGERLRFVARSKSSGRGFSGDVVYLDEAFALTAAQMGSLIPTMRAMPNPQVWYSSSAPKHDSVQLHAILNRATSDAEKRLYLAAWENPADTDPSDCAAWWRVNPAMGIRISEEAMATELRTFAGTEAGMAEFVRECLGVRESPLSHSTRLELSAFLWAAVADPSSQIVSRLAVAVDVAPDAVSASIAAAGVRSDGRGHVELIEAAVGTRWVADRLEGLIASHQPSVVAVDAAGPVNQLLPELEAVCKAARVKLVKLAPRAYAAACGEFVDAVKDKRVAHLGQQWLDDAVAAGRRRSYGDAWMWDRRVGVDVSPLVAVTVARRASVEASEVSAEPLFAYS